MGPDKFKQEDMYWWTKEDENWFDTIDRPCKGIQDSLGF